MDHICGDLGTGGPFQRDGCSAAPLVDRESVQEKSDDEQLFVAPLKWLGGFAAISYLLALVAHLAPHRWNLDPQLMFSLCPLYFVKMTFDPSLVTTFFLLAP